jgi:hypothetical protein
MRNTIRNVTMVVPVLTTNCQVSEKLNSGPVTAHTMMIAQAAMNVSGCPAAVAIQVAIVVNRRRIGP